MVVSAGGELQAQQPVVVTQATVEEPQFESSGLYRNDGRCGASFPLEDGTPAECDPNSDYW